MVPKGLDLRDLACDGYGFTAETSGMNRYMSKYLEKFKADFKEKPEQRQGKQETAVKSE